jgi:acetyl-CoA carboxylase carboxyl transferase subunit beta
MGLFTRKEKEKRPPTELEIQKEIKKAEKKEEDLWKKCAFCKELLYRKEVERNLEVCPKCSYHFPLSLDKRIAATFDKGTANELYTGIQPVDFLKFVDTKSYQLKLNETQESTKRTEAIWCGTGKIQGLDVFVGIFDFFFMGGSMGSVVGEKITRLLEDGTKQRTPVIIFCASGGARMHEGIMSLMQMAKVSGAINRLKAEGIPYITVLTDPTFGGVTASVAMLGDVIIGEPKAMIGFSGARVIKETIKQELPAGFQRAEFQLSHGMIDLICPRNELRQKLHTILSIAAA